MSAYKEKILALVKEYIHSIDPSAEVLLYGSRARGDERADSDWDILILTNYSVDLKTEQVFRHKLYDLELETGESFSVFAFSKKDWFSRQSVTPFFHNVALEGIWL